MADKEVVVDDLCVRLGGCTHGARLVEGALRVVEGVVVEEDTTVGRSERKHFCHRPRQVLGRPRLPSSPRAAGQGCSPLELIPLVRGCQACYSTGGRKG